MDDEELNQRLVTELDEILRSDTEILKAAEAAALPPHDLRARVATRNDAVYASIVPELNRLEASRERRDTIESLAAKTKYSPPRTVTVPRYSAVILIILIFLLYLLSWLTSLLGWETAWRFLADNVGWRGFIAATAVAGSLTIVATGLHFWNRNVANALLDSAEFRLLNKQIESEEIALTQALREKGIKALLRELINAEKPTYSKTFGYHEAVGLAELRDPLFEIPTRSRVRLETLLSSMPGGSIGVSGVRGVGKTTLLRRFCSPDYQSGENEARKDTLRILLSAPVRYEPREFILHLFSTVCMALTGPRHSRRRWPQYGGDMPNFGHVVLRVALVLLPFFSVAWGLVLLASVVFDWKLHASLQPGVISLFAGASAAYGYWIAQRTMRYSYVWRGRMDQDSLAETAEELLTGLAYQQSIARGWSATMNVPVGVHAGVTENTTMTEKPMGFPELVARLNAFLRMVSQQRRIYIGIDELDKIGATEDAHKFLNDIKGIFGHEDCYYLVSISQDAMSAFERRGLPIRDAFDSAFDAVVDVDYLDLDEAERLLRRRVIGMPVGFLCLCYVLSGGLPRDTIRVAREIVSLAGSSSELGELGSLAAAFVRNDILRKMHAARLVVNGVSVEPQCGMFVGVLDAAVEKLQCAPANVAKQTDSVLRSVLTSSDLNALNDKVDQPVRGRLDELTVLRVELATYLYFSASVLAFFRTDLAPDDLARAEASVGHDGVRRLARARQAFSVSPRSAWTDISTFRDAWDHEVTPFPSWLYADTIVPQSPPDMMSSNRFHGDSEDAGT